MTSQLKKSKKSSSTAQFIAEGRVEKNARENIYKAYGQTDAGRYLFVPFIYKLDHRALILSARDMDENERDLYRKG